MVVQLQRMRENHNLVQGRHTPELVAHSKGTDGGGCSVSSLQAATKITLDSQGVELLVLPAC